MKSNGNGDHRPTHINNSPEERNSRRIVYCDDGRSSGDGKRSDQQSHKITTNERVLTSLAAGALAGAVARTTIAPLDRTKIYFQTTTSTQFSARNALKFLYKSYKTAGVTSLWRGNSATMARIIPYAAIQFTAHEQYKVLFKVDHKDTHEVTRFVCGSLAGVTAQSLTYPLDLTRARLAISPPSKYTSLSDVFVKTIRNEGIGSLYKGYVPTILGVIPYAGCSFYCYESLKRMWVREYGEGSVGGFERLWFGALSGIIGQSASYPLDIVRRRSQTLEETTGNLKVFRMLVDIGRNEGIVGGLYKLLSMNFVKDPISAGISFAIFDWTNIFLRNWVLQSRK